MAEKKGPKRLWGQNGDSIERLRTVELIRIPGGSNDQFVAATDNETAGPHGTSLAVKSMVLVGAGVLVELREPPEGSKPGNWQAVVVIARDRVEYMIPAGQSEE